MSQICFLNMQNMNFPVPFLFCKTLIFVCFREIMWHSPFLLSCCCCCCCCCMWSPSWTQLDWGKEGLAQIWHFQRNLPCRKELLRNGLTSPQRSYVLFLLYFLFIFLFSIFCFCFIFRLFREKSSQTNGKKWSLSVLFQIQLWKKFSIIINFGHIFKCNFAVIKTLMSGKGCGEKTHWKRYFWNSDWIKLPAYPCCRSQLLNKNLVCSLERLKLPWNQSW